MYKLNEFLTKGYHFGFYCFNYYPWRERRGVHDFHHLINKKAYSFFFFLLDKLFEDDQYYIEYKDKKSQKK